MTWLDVPAAPLVSGSAKVRTPVTATVNPVGGRARQRLALAVRPHLIEGLSWWKPGAAVAVQRGAGEHAGMLRVTPGGKHRLRVMGGRRKAAGQSPAAVLLTLTELPGMPAKGQKPVALEFDYGDDWLEVTLPEWARAAAGASVTPRGASAPAAEPALSAEPAPAKQPYVPITQRVPDPALTRGRQTGSVVR